MRLNLAPILAEADRLIAAIEAKSWHHSVNAAHACLCAMPSPAWAEEVPGLAKYYFDEATANLWLNRLRRHVMSCLVVLTLEDGTSWEESDEWPKPTRLREAVRHLREYCPSDQSGSSLTQSGIGS